MSAPARRFNRDCRIDIGQPNSAMMIMGLQIANSLMMPYYYATLPYRLWCNARRNARGCAPIIVLFYHRVADDYPNPWTISNDRFFRQVSWLRRHFQLVSLAEAQTRIARGYNSAPAVSITFDDGYADNSAFALPTLIRYRVPFTYFVSVHHIQSGEPFAHDVKAGRPLPTNSAEELRALANAGAEIGLHTRTHPNIAQIRDPQVLHDEIVTAGEDLARLIDKPVSYFAFPYGLHQNLSREAFLLAKAVGYRGVCSAYGGYNFPGDDPFHIQRFHGDPQWSRWKNSLTVDPRKIRNIQRFVYQNDSITTCASDAGSTQDSHSTPSDQHPQDLLQKAPREV